MDKYQEAVESGTGVHLLIAHNLMYWAVNEATSNLLKVANSRSGGHLAGNDEAEAFAEAARVSAGFFQDSGQDRDPDVYHNPMVEAEKCMDLVRELVHEGQTIFPAQVICIRRISRSSREPTDREISKEIEKYQKVGIEFTSDEIRSSLIESRSGYGDYVSRNMDDACKLFSQMLESSSGATERPEDYPEWVELSFKSAQKFARDGVLNGKPKRKEQALQDFHMLKTLD